ncbi:alpha/beta hydrolase [Kocuria sp. p3-SID1433]|uniref:alpha/beta fold hydrolase n=1 Tax=unclassified Kocuria TaxID=2649579 RepID=UPI0021A3950F|nr:MULTISPECIES: alpha/beta hydrolase [unclassified Kocuria]MCT1602369.1 alpha/beta hydrolase [Kocuria sp. p3-SID1428]MCT2181171.1 alpha/beta hydrolase [Kocuria sp. p3-SID1433]
MSSQDHSIEIDDTVITYTDQGSGPVVVLLHGHAYDRSMWNAQIPALVDAGWRVIAPDLRGFGGSAITEGVVSTEEFSNDLALLLDELGIETTVVLGFSMAGQVAMQFAHDHGDRLRGLVICDTVPQAEDRAGRRRRNVGADAILAEGMDAYAEKVLGVMVSPQTIEQRPETAESVRAMIAAAPAQGSAAAMRGRAWRQDFTGLLPTLQVPSLVIVGDDDAFDNGAGQRMADALPQGRLVTIADAGHTPPMETPQEFTRALVDFLTHLN